MKTSTKMKPQRISQNEIASVAASGVSRALQARDACMRELSEQEIADVSGGASLVLSKAIIAGGPMLRNLLTTNMTAPTLDSGAMLGNFSTLG